MGRHPEGLAAALQRRLAPTESAVRIRRRRPRGRIVGGWGCRQTPPVHRDREREGSHMTCRLLDIKEVADYTGLSVHTLFTMVSQRRIPYVKMGRLTKFDREEIDKWIASHSVKVRRSFATVAP